MKSSAGPRSPGELSPARASDSAAVSDEIQADVLASQAMFAGILEIAADAIVTVDEAQQIMHFNKGAEHIFGYAPDEVIGKPLGMLLPERFRDAHPALVRGFGAGQETARRMGHRREIYGLRKSGEEFPAEASISKLRLPTGRTVYSAVLRDVTDRKRAEQDQRYLAEVSALLASSLDYEATLDTVPRLAIPRFGSWCALALVGPDDALERIVAPHADPGLARTLDAVMREYPLHWDSPWLSVDVLRTGTAIMVPEVTEDWLAAHTEDAEHQRLLRLVGASSLLSIPLIARDQVLGAITIGRSAGSAPFDEGDLALASDVAARAALAIDNARLYRTAQRATQARDIVLGIVSHDLRNPLSAIAMCASALREIAPGAAGDRVSLANTIYESTEWMQRLIQDLLDVAAIEARQLSLEREREPAEAIVQRALATFERPAAERGVGLRMEIAPAVPAVHGDAERILQVLANLVSNALKFTEAGGEVVVSVEARGSEMEFSVRDTGPGIPAGDLPHLFDLYWHARRNARSRGSGYGLAIAKGIVEAHGGRIWVESATGVGSTFRFTVPAAAGA